MISTTVRDFAARFHQAGHELYIVGGAVRDHLLGRAVGDFDFATDARPEVVQKLFPRVIPTGIQHGTVTVRFRGESFEVTTYRIDGGYSDSRHPDSVVFTGKIEEDLARRDFTINAMALDPRDGRVVDPFGGRDDVRRRIIRTVGDPMLRFNEDALRIVRAARFAVQLECAVVPETVTAMRVSAPAVARLSVERIAAELDKMMTGHRPSVGWFLLRDCDVLAQIIPELLAERDLSYQELPERPEIFAHLAASCDCAPATDLGVRWAALLHDLAKPECAKVHHGFLSFVGHDERSAQLTETVLRRLRFPNERITRVTHLVRHHMFGYDASWSDAAVRRFLGRVGVAEARDLIRLRRADNCGKRGTAAINRDLDQLERRIERVLERREAVTRADLAIHGNELMAELNLRPGRTVGLLLDELLQTVLDDPAMNERERLLEVARRFMTQRLHLGSDSIRTP